MYRTDGCLNTSDLSCTDYRANCCDQSHEYWRTGKGMLEMVGGGGMLAVSSEAMHISIPLTRGLYINEVR